MLLNLLCWNVRGIMSSAYSLSDMLDSHCIDIALITEHKLLPRSNHFLSSINSNFYAYNTCNTSFDNFGTLRCGKAGTAILIRKSLQKHISLVNNITNERIIGIEIRYNKLSPLYVFCVYMPADNDVSCYNETLCDLQAIFSHYCKLGTVIFAGDFNAQLDTDTRRPPNRKSLLLTSFIRNNGLSSLHHLFNSNAYTYVTTRSCIDHVFIENSACHIATKYSVADPKDILTSDHLPIFFSIQYGSEQIHSSPKLFNIKNINWSKCTNIHLAQYCQEIDNQATMLFTNHNICNLSPDMINSAICNIFREAEKHLPTSMFNKSAKPYWCPDLKNAHAQARYFRSIWIQEGRPRGYHHNSYSDYKAAKKTFQRLQQNCIEKYENLIFDRINQAAGSDIRLFWKLIKKRGGSNYEICNTITINGRSYHDSQVANGFFEHFYNVFGASSPEDSISPEQERELQEYASQPSTFPNRLLMEPFDPTEIDKAIGSLSRRKSPGHDSILNEHIIYGGTAAKSLLLMLFNSVLRFSRVPDDWQTSIVVPIYKGKGKPKSDPSSYRPISLIPVLSKLFEKLILFRIDKFLKTSSINFPNAQQQGFQPSLSCLTTAFALQETVLYHIERHSDVYVASLDQKAAFDTVRFRALFLKLGRLGFTGNFLTLLMSTYNNLKAVVRISGQTSAPINVNRSVRQGGVLSTFLY